MSNVVDLNLENFQATLLEQPAEQLILVELYSPRDEAGKPMSAQLIQLASQTPAIVLARVNCDEQPQITQQFGVSSVPTLVLIRAGQPIDGLVGVLPMDKVQEMLSKYLPKPEDDLLIQASAMLLDESADINQAFLLIKQAYELDSQRIDIVSCYVEVLIKLGQLAPAEELLASFALEDKNANYQRLVSLLELAQKAGESPEILALEQQLVQKPDDPHIKLQLAVTYSQANKTEQALELLFSILMSQLDFEDAKKHYLDIIASLPVGDPLASSYRRKLYSLLH
ncbi:tetratricopeptide repeat protein [Psychrobium sp. 1_MG-2023]|uniref:tetratricopeptide repeat protein n=1 Tax=Psychrobium sp. 1_MG-2023 TaxID=3062624 RepID=UPI000C32DFA4|nr:tetratricopeptide repeat protein [Psychrobium sp. 1_MG-2023]MDP2561204.1 tetratricopeptide repeat protein [Psychrobium sp. 1_MG-2023]PKF55291.1 co-chaperone YbbN [Alteromonadales bacterium alter-6D02]